MPSAQKTPLGFPQFADTDRFVPHEDYTAAMLLADSLIQELLREAEENAQLQ